MRLLTSAVLVLLIGSATTRCTRQAPAAVNVVAVRSGNELDRNSTGAPRGYEFVTLHARHAAQSETSCDFDWEGITVIDADGRRYKPTHASESRGLSVSSRLFGLQQRRVVRPHEMFAVYEVPVGTQLTRVVIGESFPLSISVARFP